MRTFVSKESDVVRKWYLVDASGKTLGRLASEIAARLRGKHKSEFTSHVDVGDYFVVINVSKIKVTGDKMQQKMYYRVSGAPGGIKEFTLEDMLKNKPERVMEHAIKGMLPKGPLGRLMLKKLKVFGGNEHTHQAQKPELIDFC